MKIKNLWLFHFLADFAAIVAAYYLTFYIRFHSQAGAGLFWLLNLLLGDTRLPPPDSVAYHDFYLVSAPRIILFLTATLGILYALLNLYPDRRFIRKRPEAGSIVLANLIALALFYMYFYLRRNVFHPRSFFATLLFLNAILSMGLRGLMQRLLESLRTRFGLDRHRAVLIGRNRHADLIHSVLEVLSPHGLTVAERLDGEGGHDWQAWLQRVRQTVRDQRADTLIVADPSLPVARIMELLELADELDLPAKVLSDKLDVLVTQARLPVDLIHGMPLVHFCAPSDAVRFQSLRHAVGRAVAAIALVLLLPLLLMIALAVKLSSRGPVFFIQERIGVDRKAFRMIKFRTMYDRASEVQAQVEEFNESGEGLFKIRRDPRVTPVGRFLRRFSLDELPQLWNVVKGKMCVVGPRPLPRRDFENYYEEWHYSRHEGMPGLTCLWQVSGRSDIDFHNMCILDVYYLRNQNWILDVKILLRTVWAVLFARGAY